MRHTRARRRPPAEPWPRAQTSPACAWSVGGRRSAVGGRRKLRRGSSPYPRERLYDDRCVVVAAPDTPPEATALELLTTQPHVVVDTDRRVFPYSVLEDNGIPYRVGRLSSDFLLVPYLVASAGGVALLRHRVATAMRALADLRIEEFPCPLPALGIDMVWNPRLTDQYFVEWLRALLFDVATSL
ncbi:MULTISPECIES: LysR substrate-binding domain-containing protein [unclassified Streptomyces]|uniref:LysR substrate-binding domain-containing protein n=1 Tax=unclassified Streptomyces TaxID=2593676 RepID=UPI00369ED9B5